MLLLVRQFLHPTTSVRHEKNIAEKKNLSFDYQWFTIPTINMCKARKCCRKEKRKRYRKTGEPNDENVVVVVKAKEGKKTLKTLKTKPGGRGGKQIKVPIKGFTISHASL